MKKFILVIYLLTISTTANALILPSKIKCINGKGDLFIVDRLDKKIFLPSHTDYKIVDDKNNVFVSEDFINRDGINTRIAIGLIEKNGFIVGGIAGYNNVTHERIYGMETLT